MAWVMMNSKVIGKEPILGTGSLRKSNRLTNVMLEKHWQFCTVTNPIHLWRAMRSSVINDTDIRQLWSPLTALSLSVVNLQSHVVNCPEGTSTHLISADCFERVATFKDNNFEMVESADEIHSGLDS